MRDLPLKKTELEDFLIKGNLNLLPATFLDAKDSQVLSRVSTVMRYWPDEELYPSLLLSLLRCPRQFKKIRSIPHLVRMISTEFFYKKKVIKAIDQYPQKRHLFVKLLKTKLEFPFGSKSVLGITTTFNLMKEREAFEELHILEAVRTILPKVSVIKGSFLDYQDKQNQVQTVYLEIEKEDKSDFSLSEMNLLHKTLPDEFKGCIEQLVPITFMRRNEEEVYRNILALRDQLKTLRDLPQATITFEEQSQFDLFFTVVLLRIVKEEEQSIQYLFEKHHPDVTFILDRIDIVGTIRKSYRKEATVFRLQLPKSQFFRKDRSVNLYKARRRVVSMLCKAVGAVRDFNGGLILKQNERLEDFQALMPDSYDEFFMENFFYSITPIAMQSILPPNLVKEWFVAFSELIETEMTRKDSYLISTRSIDEATIVIVRAEDRSFKDDLLKEINRLHIPSLELAFSEINMYGTFCFGFLYRPSLNWKDRDFCLMVRKSMKKWSEKKEQIVRIALHGNEPVLDPRITKGDQSYIILKMLFEGLTRIGPDGKPQLAIAESFEVNADFTRYTFYLRDCKWTNDTMITAKDFEYSWKKALDPKAKSIFSHTLYLIKNAKLAKKNKVSLDAVGIHVVDDKTLVVDLEYPVPYFLEATAHWTYSLINSAIDQEYPGWAYHAGDTYVCNGPFKLLEWKNSRLLTVEKNPNYWDADNVNLKKISISMLEGQNGVATFEKGDLDFMPLGSFPAALSEKAINADYVQYPLNGIYMLCFNCAQFPFNNKKIRRALCLAIDRSVFKDLISHEYGEESRSILPKGLSFSDKDLFPQMDLVAARALFKEGLGEIGFVKSDFPRLTISFYNCNNRGKLLRALCQQWKEAFQIDIHIKNYEWSTHMDRLIEDNYQMGAMELIARWQDPLHLLEAFEDQNDVLNIANWDHDQFRKNLQNAKKAKNIEERNVLLKEAEAILVEEMPAIPLYELTGCYLKKKDLNEIVASDYSQLDFKWAYKEQ